MADENEIQKFRKQFAGKSRAELIHEQRRWNAFAAEAIAATQLLDEMEEASESQRHAEAMRESHAATCFARWSFYAAIVACAIGFGAWIFPREPQATNRPDAGRSQLSPLLEQKASNSVAVLKTNSAPVKPATPPQIPSRP